MLHLVIEERSFEEDLNNLLVMHQRIYDVKDGASWVLARNPRAGTAMKDFPNFLVYETTAIGGVPSYRILYSWDARNSHIYLHSISPVLSE